MKTIYNGTVVRYGATSMNYERAIEHPESALHIFVTLCGVMLAGAALYILAGV